MRKALVDFIKGADSLGYEFKVLYKGKERFSTLCGGLVSLMMQGLLFYLIGTSAYEMFFMDDPKIATITKPLSREEKIDLVPILFSDNDYTIAFRTEVWINNNMN